MNALLHWDDDGLWVAMLTAIVFPIICFAGFLSRLPTLAQVLVAMVLLGAPIIADICDAHKM